MLQESYKVHITLYAATLPRQRSSSGPVPTAWCHPGGEVRDVTNEKNGLFTPKSLSETSKNKKPLHSLKMKGLVL